MTEASNNNLTKNSINNPNGYRTVLVTGGAGYVGSSLVPELLREGYRVKVIDLFWYGREVFAEVAGHPNLNLVELDIREARRMREELAGQDAVIHLACISNDPSFDLAPALGTSINLDAFLPLVQAAVEQGVRRFIYASSSSIYGVQDHPEVKEDTEPRPLTDYSRFKLACEKMLLDYSDAGQMERVILRPATVCGYAPRLRLDVVVNILTAHALTNRKIRILGGEQLRPNIHIADMVRAYQAILNASPDQVDGQAFNVGYQNLPVEEIARLVRDTVGDPGIELERVSSDDNRSYHINSDKIRAALGFRPIHKVEDAVRSLVDAYRDGRIVDPMTNDRYYNIKRMQEINAR
ncbi:MAG: NAD-dependent epimerase/dehydratase family protein [Myxococcales bacterium]|nr:NAD-dependent epimerase/dehydratase family protein [Myxococcales bacterium]